MPSAIPLSSEHVTDDGIFLLENGEDALIYIGNSVDPETLRKLFGISSVDEISTQVIWFPSKFFFESELRLVGSTCFCSSVHLILSD